MYLYISQNKFLILLLFILHFIQIFHYLCSYRQFPRIQAPGSVGPALHTTRAAAFQALWGAAAFRTLQGAAFHALGYT